MTTTNDTDLNHWLSQPAQPVESAACFHGAHDDCATENCPCEHHQMDQLDVPKLLKETKEHGQYASVVTARAAIADVLDAGDDGWNWIFSLSESTVETENRVRFMDAVVQRITELQAPSHEMDAGLNGLIARAKKVLRRGRRR